MLNFLLDASGSLPVGYKKIGIGEAALDALLGFIVVFIGIAFLVGLLWLIGFAVRKINGAPAKKKEEKAAEKIEKNACIFAAGVVVCILLFYVFSERGD